MRYGVAVEEVDVGVVYEHVVVEGLGDEVVFNDGA